nr:3-isopropylmalate dehydrogenase, chloroplastic-like [Tanacetum cinerariifolium]
DKANPLATILSVEMILKYRLREVKEIERIELVVLDTLNNRLCIDDICSARDMTLELANRAICTPDGIARNVFVLVDIDSFNDIHPYFDDDPLSGNTAYKANSLLEEFADELALISYPPDYDDYRACDIESDIKEIEFLLFQGEDSDFKESIDQSVLTNLDDLFVDPTPEMFIDEQPSDYSFPPRFDVYPDNFLEIES